MTPTVKLERDRWRARASAPVTDASNMRFHWIFAVRLVGQSTTALQLFDHVEHFAMMFGR
jgi:hypothetical protein